MANRFEDADYEPNEDEVLTPEQAELQTAMDFFAGKCDRNGNYFP